MEFILIWIICGVIAAAIGSSNGENGCSWFGIGIILGPLGVILSFFAKGKEQKEREKAKKGYSSIYKVCPMCAEIIKKEAIVCKHCGSNLSKDQGNDESGPKHITD